MTNQDSKNQFQPRQQAVVNQKLYLSSLIQETKRFINESIKPQTMGMHNNTATTQLPNIMLLTNLSDLPCLPTMEQMEQQYGQNLE